MGLEEENQKRLNFTSETYTAFTLNFINCLEIIRIYQTT